MLFHCSLLRILLFPALAFLVGCSSGPSDVIINKKDTTHFVLKISPDSASARIGSTLLFTLNSTPALPKRHTIDWSIDAEMFTRTNADTFSNKFGTLGTHTLKAVYSDSTGSRHDSVSTTISITDTTTPPPLTDLGAFKFIVNHDTLDRSRYRTNCMAEATYRPGYLQLDITYSETMFGGLDTRHILITGPIDRPVPASYAIAAFNSGQGLNASYSYSNVRYSSLNGGLLTITTFDTINNLISGTLTFTALRYQQSDVDTIAGAFSAVGIINQAFRQGKMTATVDGKEFLPFYGPEKSVQSNMRPDKPLLHIQADGRGDSGIVNLSLTINTPQVGTFSFSDASTSGRVSCYYRTQSQVFSTDVHPNNGTLTITAYDPVNRRISGTFSTSAYLSDGTNTKIEITNGVLDNVTWAQD